MPALPTHLSDIRASATGSLSLLQGEDAMRAIERVTAGERASRPGNIFHSQALMLASGRASLSRGTPCIAACVLRNGAIETVWPLRIMRDMAVSIATDLADPVAQYSDVMGAPMDGESLALLGHRLRTDFGADALLARRVRSDSGLDSGLADVATVIDQNEAPFADLAAFGSFERYLASFSKATARKIRQRRARLENAHGALSFESLQGDRAREAVQIAAGWKRAWLGAQALTSRVFDGIANEALLIEASAAPNANASVLRAGNRAIAIELGFISGPHYAAYLGTFDPAFAAYSPGQEQMLRTIEWAFAQGFERYDLLSPADSYKLHWSRGKSAERVRDYGIALSRVGGMYLFMRRHARARVQRTIDAMPVAMRQAARRYGKVAISVGGTAAAMGLLND